MYDYRKSIKSSVSDELINTHLIRPIAGLVVRVLYDKRVTPNQVTVASTIAGLAAALVYLRGEYAAFVCAGLLVTLKDILDSADGQLARARQQYSRAGRFLDSIGDFVVNVAVFGAIGWMLSRRHGDGLYGILALGGLLGITFRVSYHVFYQTSFLHLQKTYQTNRVTEEIVEEDVRGDRSTLVLQGVFQIIYGWQDRLVQSIDRWCRGDVERQEWLGEWYSDRAGLQMSGFLGMGTELFLLMMFSVFNNLELYLFFNLVGSNLLLLTNIVYRRLFLRNRLAGSAIL